MTFDISRFYHALSMYEFVDEIQIDDVFPELINVIVWLLFETFCSDIFWIEQ